jgi:hypothetical protein
MVLRRAHDLVVVVTIGEMEHVPAIGGPLIDEPVAVELLVHHATDERVVDAGIVVGQEDPEALANLERDGLRLDFLGMPLGHGELALERDDLGRAHGSAHDVPERGLARRRRDPHPRRAAVDVVGDVCGLDVPGQGTDAASLGLSEQGMIRQTLIGQECLERPRAATESQGVDGQHGDVRRDVVAAVTRRLVLAVEGLAQDHPQRVAGGGAVACRQHELVTVRMLGAPVVVPEPTQLGPGEVARHVERRIGERTAEMPGLGIVAEQGESHAGHVANVFQPLALVDSLEAVADSGEV